MPIRVGINGFGRIGRLVFRAMAARKGEFDVVLVNDLTKPDMLANLLKYDSTHRKFPGTVEVKDNNLIVNGDEVKITAERDPAAIPWGANKVDVVLESTGVFTKRDGMEKHLPAAHRRSSSVLLRKIKMPLMRPS